MDPGYPDYPGYVEVEVDEKIEEAIARSQREEEVAGPSQPFHKRQRARKTLGSQLEFKAPRDNIQVFPDPTLKIFFSKAYLSYI